MPFFGASFFQAVEGYGDAVIVGYLHALWHYWNHTHCEGLPDDDEYLRKLCRCDPQEWARTKGIIFDDRYFFCKNGTHWHQKNAKELHDSDLAIYQKRVALAENARLQKAGITAGINPNTNAVTRISQEKELERVEKRLAELRAAGTTTATGTMYTTPQKAELRTLKDRREELKKSLGFSA